MHGKTTPCIFAQDTRRKANSILNTSAVKNNEFLILASISKKEKIEGKGLIITNKPFLSHSKKAKINFMKQIMLIKKVLRPSQYKGVNYKA